ncbi:MAG: ATP-binding cassette domain-containing protein [Alphaproteobacteria bacterium]|nr:ATP-binding cassette domain-containing protein [Alphaproteobacteria bacterium]
MFLSLRQITKRFGHVTALDHISLDIAEGEFLCFLGPSGCGKTTLLRVIAGLETPDEGEIRLQEGRLDAVPARQRNFGVVFQSYSLFPNMTVARNVAYGLECRGWRGTRKDERVRAMLELVHLADQSDKLPHQLSGGQQQRVALARALAPEPKVLLLDEPLSALDAKVREELRGEIRDLQRALRITTVMVTHDQDEAMELADRIVLMNQGVIEQIGRAEELYEQPANRFVAEFIGRMNVLSGFGSAGEAGLIGVRPEHLELIDGAAAGADAIVGRIEKSVFLGSVTRLTLRAGDQRLVVELRGKPANAVPGATLAVRIPPQSVHRIRGAPP